MRARKPAPPHSADSAGVTGANYEKRATSFGALMGYSPDGWPVVREGQPEFLDWLEYFFHIGHPHGRSASFAARHGVLTVPASSPHDFDPGWQARPRQPMQAPPQREELRRRPPLSREELHWRRIGAEKILNRPREAAE